MINLFQIRDEFYIYNMILLSRIVIDKFIYIVRLTEPESALIVKVAKQEMTGWDSGVGRDVTA